MKRAEKRASVHVWTGRKVPTSQTRTLLTILTWFMRELQISLKS